MAMHGRRGPHALMGRGYKRSRPFRVLLGRMIGYLGRFKRIVAIGAIFSLMASVVSIFDPLVLQRGIDAVFDSDSTLNLLLFLVGLYIAFKLISWVLRSVNTWILADAQAGFVQNIQADVYDHLVKADLSYHKAEQSGNVTSRVTTDTVALGTGIQVLINFASQALLIVSTFILLWIVSPIIALTSLVVVPGVILLMAIFGTWGQRVMLASQRAYGEVSGQIAEHLSGVHVAKAFNREQELAGKINELNQKAYRYGFRFMLLMTAMQPLVRAIGQLAIATLLFVGGSLATGAAAQLTIGEVFLGIILVNRFLFPLLALVMNATQVQASLAAMDRISDVLESTPAIMDQPNTFPLHIESDGIRFEDLTFSYDGNTPVLKNVNFAIEPGEMVAVVGHTGAGKTTLAALINRFYDPQQGRILIGEQDLREVTLASLHDNISLIPQEPYLFDGTIIENIRYGHPAATDEEIMELCQILGANEFIEVLADGYHTQIVENGKNLSAGQRQMITIARTMLANPKILILDEATARLDAYSESLVQAAQEKLFAGRTTVVIAHRLTTIANASRIIVFDHGEIIEEGTHEELLAMDGTFKAVYDTYYAHQGLEELTEEIAQVAEAEVAKVGGEAAITAAPGQITMGIGMGQGMGGMGFPGHGPGFGPPSPEMLEKMVEHAPPEMLEMMAEQIPPEILKKMYERMKTNPESIPHKLREIIKKRMKTDNPDADVHSLGQEESSS
ncbi:MAG: ABC transporter ATP-binding protein [Candidatus Heimdallarchaeota archaeon]